MPDLHWNDRIYYTAEQKAEALGERFYPLTNAKLDDIDTEKLLFEDYSSEQAIRTTTVTTTEEIQDIIADSQPDKCPGCHRHGGVKGGAPQGRGCLRPHAPPSTLLTRR